MSYANIERPARRPIAAFAGPPGHGAPSTVEIANALADAFNDFKASHARDIQEVRDHFDAQAKAIARLTVGGDGIGTDATPDGAILAQFNAALRGERRDRPALDAAAHRAYANAFGQFLRVGAQALHPDIRAEMQVGSDPSGGFLVPNERGPFITRLFEASDIRRLATVYGSTYGSAMELPIDNDEAASGGWVGENEARNDTSTPGVGLHRIELEEQFAMPVATQRMLDDADFDVATWLMGKMADIIGRTENAAFVVGDGVKKPFGFLIRAQNATTQDDGVRKWGIPQYVPSGAAGGIPTLASGASNGDAFLTLISKLKKPYRRNAKFFMNRATEGMVSKMKDAEGRYIWTRGNMAEGVPSTLHGYPIELIEEMPDPAADSLAIAFGDMAAAYTILDRPGIRVLRDDLTTKGKVKFYGYRRVGGDLTNSEALKFMRLSAA